MAPQATNLGDGRDAGRYTIRTDMVLRLLMSLQAEEHYVELDLTYDVNPGREQSYLEPGEPANVQIRTARIAGEDAPDWLWPMLEADEELEREMLMEAWEASEAARDDHADMIREERLLERGQ